MGRYYSGDIEGKLWFGVQSSNDADKFGVMGKQPMELRYYFDKTNLPDINSGIKKCKTELKEFKKKIDDYLKNNMGYNSPVLAKHLNIPEKDLDYYLQIYARLELGNKILDCVKTTGHCEFTAEL